MKGSERKMWVAPSRPFADGRYRSGTVIRPTKNDVDCVVLTDLQLLYALVLFNASIVTEGEKSEQEYEDDPYVHVHGIC